MRALKPLKSQASIEVLTAVSLAFVFLIFSYLSFVNDQATATRQADFAQARRSVEETAALFNAANRVEGFYAEFQVPLLSRPFTLNLTNYSVTGLLQVGAQQTEIPALINATVYCTQCVLSTGQYWLYNTNGVLTVAQKS